MAHAEAPPSFRSLLSCCRKTSSRTTCTRTRPCGGSPPSPPLPGWPGPTGSTAPPASAPRTWPPVCRHTHTHIYTHTHTHIHTYSHTVADLGMGEPGSRPGRHLLGGGTSSYWSRALLTIILGNWHIGARCGCSGRCSAQKLCEKAP